MKIITTTELQQKIGDISKEIEKTTYIVTNRGKAKFVIVPYFDGCNELIEDYYEDFEIHQNKEKLSQRYKESLESGLSDFTI